MVLGLRLRRVLGKKKKRKLLYGPGLCTFRGALGFLVIFKVLSLEFRVPVGKGGSELWITSLAFRFEFGISGPYKSNPSTLIPKS